MDLSIIIVNWNTCELLKNCLCSIEAHPPNHAYEVIVVDNDSKDTSVEMVRRDFPGVRLICNQTNTGFATANNQGIVESSGKYVLLLNSDTEVKSQALSRLIDFMDAHAEAGAVGPMLRNPDGSLQTSCYPFPTIRRELWRLFHLDLLRPYGVYWMHSWDTRQTREVDHIKGASLVLRREALDQVGLLDEDFFMYSEELDLCYRIKKSAWKLFWEPRSEVIHFGGQSTKQAAAKMFLELYRSKILFFRKNQPNKTGIYKLTLYAASIFRLLFTPLVLLEKDTLRTIHLATAKNYFRLIQQLPRM